jgi:hypothetical protein
MARLGLKTQHGALRDCVGPTGPKSRYRPIRKKLHSKLGISLPA